MNANYFNIGGGKTDVLKMFMSLMIVLLHTTSIGILSPILRCAVPMFFMVSAYFFFTKYDNISDENEQKKLWLHYIKRNIQLYLFWFFVLLPFTIVYRGWYNGDLIHNLSQCVRYFLFSSTFPVSWYIMASIIGVSLITILGKYLNNWVLLILSLLVYILCCLATNYRVVLDRGPLGPIYDNYVAIFTGPYNSFPVSLIWILLGRLLVRSTGKLSRLNIKILWGGLFVGFILLYMEYFAVCKYGLVYKDDCYLMLLPVCICTIILFGRYKLELPIMPTLRKTSTVVFCCHLPIGITLRYLLKSQGIQFDIVVFIATLILSLLVTLVIIKFERRYNILKFSY